MAGHFLLGWPGRTQSQGSFSPSRQQNDVTLRTMAPSWIQPGPKAGPGAGACGRVLERHAGQDKGLGCSTGLCLCEVMLISTALSPTKKVGCAHLLFGKHRKTERKQNPPVILTAVRTTLGIQMHFLPVFFSSLPQTKLPIFHVFLTFQKRSSFTYL